MNRQTWITLLGLIAVTLPGAAGGAEAPDAKAHAAKMQQAGWKAVSEGVYERQLGPNKVERLGFGREGFSATLGDLNRRLAALEKEQELFPSPKLAKIIEELRLRIGQTQAQLRDMDLEEEGGGMTSAALAVTGNSCSSICYSATADAYPLTSSQGVAAVANASFNSACGYSGETYAYAYSRATVGTTTTTHTVSDPDSGTSVTSSATATSNGGSVSGIPCYSEASSYAQSTALGISYSTSDTNSSCPAVSCTSATISGTTYEVFFLNNCRNRTWTVAPNSGCTASTYQWKYNGTVVGTGSTYTRSVCAGNYSFTLTATVNGTLVDTHAVTVEYEPEPMCGGVPC